MKYLLIISLLVNFIFIVNWLLDRVVIPKREYDLNDLEKGDRIIIDLCGEEKMVKVSDNNANLRVITLEWESGDGIYVHTASYNDKIFTNYISDYHDLE